MKNPFINPIIGLGTFPPSGPPITTTPLPTCREDADPGDEAPARPEAKKEDLRDRARRKLREQEEAAAKLEASKATFDKEAYDLRGAMQDAKVVLERVSPAKAAMERQSFQINRMKPAVEQARREYEAQAAVTDEERRQMAPKPGYVKPNGWSIDCLTWRNVPHPKGDTSSFVPTPMSEILREAQEDEPIGRYFAKFYTR